MWPSKTDKAAQESGRQSEGVQIEVEPLAKGRALACALAVHGVGGRGGTETGRAQMAQRRDERASKRARVGKRERALGACGSRVRSSNMS